MMPGMASGKSIRASSASVSKTHAAGGFANLIGHRVQPDDELERGSAVL